MTDVNNDETQFLIILEHYKTKMEEKNVPDQSNNVILSEINEIEYRVNYANLAELGLIQADRGVNSNDQLTYTPTTGITPSGITLVETFLESCYLDYPSLDNKIRPHLFNLLELEMTRDENDKLYQKQIRVMTGLIRAIN